MFDTSNCWSVVSQHGANCVVIAFRQNQYHYKYFQDKVDQENDSIENLEISKTSLQARLSDLCVLHEIANAYPDHSLQEDKSGIEQAVEV